MLSKFMKNFNLLFTAILSLVLVNLYAQPEAGMPAVPGKCYAKCLIADQYETVTEQVLIKEASSKVSVTPAKYEKVSEQVLSREAATALSVSPARFENASEQVLVRESGKKVSITPARFESMSEQVIRQIDAPGVAVVPAAFETMTEQVLVQDAYTELRVVPAKFETVTEQVLVQDAYTTLKVVPAIYETVTEQVLVKEGYSTISVAPAITDLAGLLKMVNDGGTTYTASNGRTRTFTASEIAAIKSLAGTNARLSTDDNGNVYATMTEQVLEKEGFKTISTSGAKYETVTEQVLVKEAGTRIETQPAGFETVSETLMTSPASTKWVKKQADKNCLSADPNDCLVWCLVEVPEQYKTFTKQVRKACANGWTASGDDCVRTVEVPAQYTTRTYQKLVSPASSQSSDVAAKYTTRTYQKLVLPAATTTEKVPAQYTTRTYRKVSKPATTEATKVPAKYETRTFQKLVSPATTQVVEVPAKYATRSYKKLSADATTQTIACGKSAVLEGINFRTASAELLPSSNAEIKRLEQLLKSKPAVSARLVGHTDSDGSESSNEILSTARAKAVYDALIASGISASSLSYEGKGESEPIATNATEAGKLKNRRTEFITFGDDEGPGDCTLYDTRTYQKLAADASASISDIAAQYTTRTYQKLAADASVSSSDVPAQYQTRTYEKLAAAASTSTSNISAQYNTITKRNLVKAGGFTEWREVVCESDITPDLYRKVQQALNDKGYNVGTVDGVIGAGTKAQLVKFQRDNGLPIGQLDIETLKALGVRN